jgi:hypothetical protein
MSEVVEKEIKRYSYSKELWADVLNLYMRGFTHRQTRRVLMQKYEQVPASMTIKSKMKNYNDEIKDARRQNAEVDILVALDNELDHLEDISDDILHYAIPQTMADMEADKFKELPVEDKLRIVLREVNAKAQRVERKMLRLDPDANSATPLQIFIQNAQKARREDNGATVDASPDIIDVAFVEE